MSGIYLHIRDQPQLYLACDHRSRPPRTWLIIGVRSGNPVHLSNKRITMRRSARCLCLPRAALVRAGTHSCDKINLPIKMVRGPGLCGPATLSTSKIDRALPRSAIRQSASPRASYWCGLCFRGLAVLIGWRPSLYRGLYSPSRA
jgi:hypothetical protein